MRRILAFISASMSGLAMALLLCNAARGGLVAMQGPLTMRTANLWLQADESGQVRVEYRTDQSSAQARQSDTVVLNAQ